MHEAPTGSPLCVPPRNTLQSQQPWRPPQHHPHCFYILRTPTPWLLSPHEAPSSSKARGWSSDHTRRRRERDRAVLSAPHRGPCELLRIHHAASNLRRVHVAPSWPQREVSPGRLPHACQEYQSQTATRRCHRPKVHLRFRGVTGRDVCAQNRRRRHIHFPEFLRKQLQRGCKSLEVTQPGKPDTASAADPQACSSPPSPRLLSCQVWLQNQRCHFAHLLPRVLRFRGADHWLTASATAGAGAFSVLPSGRP